MRPVAWRGVDRPPDGRHYSARARHVPNDAENTMSELNATALFPTFLFVRDHPDAERLNRELIRNGERLRASDPQGVQISNRGGWQSHDDLNRRSEFSSFIGFVEETLGQVKEFLNIADDVTLRVFACWMNINNRGHFNDLHVHSNSVFSGVYYVKIPEGCGGIRFFDPNPIRICFHPPYKTIDPKNCFTHEYDPLAGRILIFPGYVPHDVAENRADDVRVSMSFNVGLV